MIPAWGGNSQAQLNFQAKKKKEKKSFRPNIMRSGSRENTAASPFSFTEVAMIHVHIKIRAHRVGKHFTGVTIYRQPKGCCYIP